MRPRKCGTNSFESNSGKSPNDRPGFEPTAFGHERTKTLARSIWPAGRWLIGSRHFQASSHGQKSSPPSLFADLSELASNSQDSDLGATQPAPAPGLALHPSDLGLPKPSPALQFCLFSAAPTLQPSPTLRQTSSSTHILRMFYFMAGPTAPFTEVV